MCVSEGKAAGVKGVLSEGGVPQLSEPLRFKLTWAEISVYLWSDEELLLRSSCEEQLLLSRSVHQWLSSGRQPGSKENPTSDLKQTSGRSYKRLEELPVSSSSSPGLEKPQGWSPGVAQAAEEQTSVHGSRCFR